MISINSDNLVDQKQKYIEEEKPFSYEFLEVKNETGKRSSKSLQNLPPFDEKVQHRVWKEMERSFFHDYEIKPFMFHRYYIILPTKEGVWRALVIKDENPVTFNFSGKIEYNLNEACKLFPKILHNRKFVIKFLKPPSVTSLLTKSTLTLRDKWQTDMTKWLESVSDEFLTTVIKAKKNAFDCFARLELEPTHPKSQELLKTFNLTPPLPIGFTVYQGQSSYREWVYFKNCQINDSFYLRSPLCSSIDPNVCCSFIEEKSDCPILAILKVASDNIRALPITLIYKEALKRGMLIGDLKLLLYEEEVLISPTIYQINDIRDKSWFTFRYSNGDKDVRETKIYEINLYSPSSLEKPKEPYYFQVFKKTG